MDLVTEALADAIRLILSRDPELLRIAGLSLAVSGAAALLAGLLGVTLGAALHLGRWPGRRSLALAVNTGMGLPPVVVGLVVTLLLWRTGPFGALRLLYTPPAMVLAQFIVALPLVAGFTRAALDLLDADLAPALRADGAGDRRVAYELVRASFAQVLVAVAAGFGRAIAEVGASLMVGGNIVGQTRIFTTAIALEAGRGDFALALALGFVLLLVALIVNAGLGAAARVRTTM
jgi:tungstate transport system permease protein